MAVPFQVQNLTTEQSDGNILLSWDASLGATTYQIQRSTDGVNFTNLIVVGLLTQYVDSLPGIGIQYWYRIAPINGSGIGPYSSSSSMIAALPSEMSLLELRLRAQETADRVDSQFVITSEWNAFLRISMYELYDLLITTYEDLFSSESVSIMTNGTTTNYALPDGATNYLGGIYGGTSGAPAKAFYKLSGVDLSVNTNVITPARVTINRFDFIDRNKYVYPNSNSTIYGVFNMRYRLMGNNINFIPTPSGGQQVILWYSPKLPSLLKDTDLTNIGYSGWLRYPIVRAAKYALDKEEGSDTSKLDAELLFLKTRIEQSASNRDAGQPDTISETRKDGIWGNGYGGNNSGSSGGW